MTVENQKEIVSPLEGKEAGAVNIIDKADAGAVDAAVDKNPHMNAAVVEATEGDDEIKGTPETEEERLARDKRLEESQFKDAMYLIGRDFAISPDELSKIQTFIDAGKIDGIASKTWEKDGRSYNIGHLLINGLNAIKTPSKQDIENYKNIVSQLNDITKYNSTIDLVLLDVSVSEALNRKEFDMIVANLKPNLDLTVANTVYTKYLENTNVKELLNLTSTEKATKILNQIDPARIEKFNKLLLTKTLTDTGVFTPDILKNNIFNYYSDALNSNMEEINKYSDTQKSDLAFNLVAMKPLSVDEKNKTLAEGYTFEKVDEALKKGYKIVNKLTNSNNSTGIDTWQEKSGNETKSYGEITEDLFQEYSEQKEKLRHIDMLTVYKSLYAPASDIPPMSPVNVIATGDGSSTSSNGQGRETFGYNFEQPDKQINNIYFGLNKDEDMEINLSANGLDMKSGKGGATMKINFVGTKNGKPDVFTIDGIYTDTGLQFVNNPLDITITKPRLNDATIAIPKEYNGYDISMEQISGAYDLFAGSYDEINTNVTIKNGRLDGGGEFGSPKLGQPNKETTYRGGEWGILEQDQKDIKKAMADIYHYTYRSVAEKIPMQIKAGVNDAKITGNLANYQTLSGLETITNEKLKTAFSEYQADITSKTNAQLSFPSDGDEAQSNAQKILAQNRFISVLQLIQQDPDLLSLITSGRVEIKPEYLAKQKAASISTDPISYNKINN